ncbi:MAG: cytochrome c oxidase subunit II [Halohasta sp.]
MNAKRLALASLLSAAMMALVADPVAAQSTSADLIGELNIKLLYIALPITLLVEIILIYAVIRFKNNDEPKPTKENRRLEITWTVATAIILLFVGVASYGVMADPSVTFTGGEDEVAPDDGDVYVEAEAYQWGWTMTYPDHDITAPEGENGPVITVPEGQDIYVGVTSEDVIHGFHVPDLGMKMDAMPDQVQYIKTTPEETGTYQGYCSEYCGVAHSQMYFTVEVVDQAEYDQWVDEQTESESDDEAGNETNESA